MNDAQDRQHAAPADPLQSAHIEGQNPSTPERLPGHTRYHALRSYSVATLSFSSLAMIAIALLALATLIAILAAAG